MTARLQHMMTIAEQNAQEQEGGISLTTVCAIIFAVFALCLICFLLGFLDGYDRGRVFQKELASREEQCLAGTCVKP